MAGAGPVLRNGQFRHRPCSEQALSLKLVKIGARLVRHGRYVVFQLAAVAVPRAPFAAILRRSDRLRGPPVAAT
jgi:hypothetical protein